MPKFIIPCEWTMYTEIDIKADTLEEAINQVNALPLPSGEYSADSFIVRSDLLKELNPTIKS